MILEDKYISRKPLKCLELKKSAELVTQNGNSDSLARKLQDISSKKLNRKTYFT